MSTLKKLIDDTQVELQAELDKLYKSIQDIPQDILVLLLSGDFSCIKYAKDYYIMYKGSIIPKDCELFGDTKRYPYHCCSIEDFLLIDNLITKFQRDIQDCIKSFISACAESSIKDITEENRKSYILKGIQAFLDREYSTKDGLIIEYRGIKYKYLEDERFSYRLVIPRLYSEIDKGIFMDMQDLVEYIELTHVKKQVKHVEKRLKDLKQIYAC